MTRRYAGLLAAALLLTPPLSHGARSGAGCYIPLEQGVLMGINRSTRTVQLPMGEREAGESLAETAARETLEETGLVVEVGAQLLSLDDKSIALFLCSPRSPVGPLAGLRPVDDYEVEEVLVLDPHTLRNFDGRRIDLPWRHPSVRYLLRMLFAPANR